MTSSESCGGALRGASGTPAGQRPDEIRQRPGWGDRRPAVLFIALSAACFCVYLFGLYPTLSPYRDSGDLAASAWTLGVAHPPGYPLYLLLGRLWLGLLPLGTVGYRLNVLSALAGACACGLLALCVLRGSAAPAPGRRPLLAGAAAGILLGLAPAFWRLSSVSEMYSCNALVGAALLWLAIPERNEPGGRPRALFLSALLLGLGLGNHQTLAAAVPGLLWMARPSLRRRTAVLMGGFFALGLALYLYLPVRSHAGPVLDWGEPETLRNFLRMLARADYGGVRLHPDRPSGLWPPGAWGAGLLLSGKAMVRELGWAGLLLGLWGVWTGRSRRMVQGSLLAFLLSGPLFILWANLDPSRPETSAILEPHLILPLVFAAALAGWGAADLLGRSPGRGRTAGALALLAAAWFLPRRDALAAGFGPRGDFSAWDYGLGLQASLPRGALLLDPDDPTAFTMSYLARAHGRRRDVVPLMYFRTRWGYEQLRRVHPGLLPSGELRNSQELLDALLRHNLAAGRPIFLDLPQKTPGGCRTFPVGLAYRLSPDGAAVDGRALLARAQALWELSRVRPVPPDSDFFSRHTLAYWASALNNLGIEAQRLGDPRLAQALYRRSLVLVPELAEAWNNMGNAAVDLKDYGAAEGCYLASLRLKPAPQGTYNLGRAYLLAGRFAEAERAFAQAADAGSLEALNDLGLVLMRTGRTEEAVEKWLSILRRQEDYLLAYYNLGIAYEALGRRDRAAAAVRVYARLAGDPDERRGAGAWLQRLEN